MLATVMAFFGRSQRVTLAIGLLQMLVTEHWDTLWELGNKKQAFKKMVAKLRRTKGVDDDPFEAFADCCEKLMAA
jgi:hypothetical protein